jgi:hypothetical protein
VGGYWNDNDQCSKDEFRRDCGSELFSRKAVATGVAAGRQSGRSVCVCGEVDEDLLQAELREPAAYAEAGEFFPYPGAG